jgi:carbon monoxide dehydrogenase subunit G
VRARTLDDWEIEAGHAMLLKLTEELPLNASIDEVWQMLRDIPRLTGLLPGVENVRSLSEESVEGYAARISEKVGPFKITMDVEASLTETIEPSLLKAAIKGVDSMGLNRITGSMQVALCPVSSGTQMHFEGSIEILGKLASLGAIPIRRRTTQAFAEFARNIQDQFTKDRS